MSAPASHLRRLAIPQPVVVAEAERCDLCAGPLAAEHRHVADVRARSLLCACRACVLLLDNKNAGGGHFRLTPERRLYLDAIQFDDGLWNSLNIPVELAFFFRASSTGRIAAVYPGAMGATESQLDLAAWEELEAANPVLLDLEDDVEALLVNRAGRRHAHYVVPIDDCYALSGVLRTHWKGFGGGAEVWREIDGFFDRLHRRATREGA